MHYFILLLTLLGVLYPECIFFTVGLQGGYCLHFNGYKHLGLVRYMICSFVLLLIVPLLLPVLTLT